MSNGTEIIDSNKSCWNSIGVWGNSVGRCPKLVEITHCRNCPVFIAAGSDLLNREFPQGYVEEWTEIIAQKKEAQNTNNISVIIFRIGQELLALRSTVFKEIINPRQVHRIPHRSNNVLAGVTNVHGELQLCFSLKALIGNNDTEVADDSAARMLVIQHNGECWVFTVDQVLGVFRCSDSDTQNVPVTVSKASGTFTKKVIICDHREVGLLDDELLIYTLQRRIS